MQRRRELRIGCLALLACGDGDATRAPQAANVEDGAEAAATAPVAASGSGPSTEGRSGEADASIDPEALGESGTVEMKQYSVAYIGSGTLGKGTLTYQGRRVPFRIGGLGIGGIGIASIDAHGSVYDLPDLESFAGTYGNARLGITAADKGKGRLWLKNTNGVVLKLWTEMKGLALSGGVDGIVIPWESDVREAVGGLKEASQEMVRGAEQGTKKAWDSAKDKLR